MLLQSGITVPPLREMTEDIPDIADYLLAIYAHKTSQTRKRLDASAIKALKLYPWPGNIRELKDTILMAAFHADGETILKQSRLVALPRVIFPLYLIQSC